MSRARKCLLSFSIQRLRDSQPATFETPVYAPLICSVQGPTSPAAPGLMVHNTVPVFTDVSMIVLKAFLLMMSMPDMWKVFPMNGVRLLEYHRESLSEK